MKTAIYITLIMAFIIACNSSKPVVSSSSGNLENIKENDTVKIANDSLEYEIIIIEPGFNAWMVGNARPEGFYSQKLLESRNIIYVNEWNRRAANPFQFNSNLYQMPIDYRDGIDYGYEVNYKLYNYFIYFQLTYNQRLGPFTPRI
ncbi:hypothetical protein KO566_11025 [Flavobacteriaceae bacterium XHP0103]|uniref:DUF6146 family protein n=1 Tax=Marixanthotalea marina TaxID=2844359 RepID=UPI002989C9EC|nr:DUF6146 family protein [Marixanthotalea marina]MBU3822597.1 hypothetical protein [Marixanthotalea marina]